MASFDGFDGLVVCDKCREDIGERERFIKREKAGQVETFHAKCAPELAKSNLDLALERWAPKPL